jgi:hypothetical protein
MYKTGLQHFQGNKFIINSELDQFKVPGNLQKLSTWLSFSRHPDLDRQALDADPDQKAYRYVSDRIRILPSGRLLIYMDF